uniref:Protein kinase domain-containing protein n=1 Tax=Rhizophagus irregularis (strain DAOM 181602 / DAOM 197198 / MUCL 43194) TaxID=747089 RepID=U9V3V1_RHIID
METKLSNLNISDEDTDTIITKNCCKPFTKELWGSAENGDKEAMFNLAICYKNGEGTEKNLEKAFYWYQKAAENAAENGNEVAMNNLAICYENGNGTEKNLEEASYWYQKAAQQGISNVQYRPRFLYRIGKVKKVLEKHVNWSKNAEKECLSANKWIENALKYEKVKFISYKELKNTERLYAGGFGTISKAIWTKTNNYVICKKLTNTTYIKNDLLDAFIHELKMHMHLNYSDRIIRCFGISSDPKTNEYLLIMQYANDGDLQNYLKNNFKDLTWNDKKKLAFQIADGLNYLHNENILHRDLHSKNIAIHENNAKIMDFGISKNQNNQTSTAYVGNFGVVAYMEPRRFVDPNFPYTKSSDVYSFGVLMWEISSGYPPFKDNDNKVALAVSISNGAREVTILGTPKEYEKLYKNCWNQEPEQRPTINEILDEFERMGFVNIVTNKLVKGSDNLTSELQASAESIQIESTQISLNLQNNLVSVTLDVYSILFRGNNFDQYVEIIFDLWTVMRMFGRKNYDKVMFAFISDIQYWITIQHPIVNTLKSQLQMFDEYPVENTIIPGGKVLPS